ncbi:probable xyloglucan endotransglucosylase/hydrolase protein 5 [Physcomitrium patens]|uniref:GH16 domain-containing protein n=1 Tax=Physcomitrium patens TaxID=3218 RepID=A0A2K1J0D0_PHYPA|nr:probable xyloglucan endotransglucosylase/hydrolase protein 5 [Physcomitrium patens]PNR34978.1 hypothetical protein PHYPA_022877 [Physcomitrium patens]|eukprot:XP_024402165.1 probable xyloglucan endotransglucosylase/hydrolase protein 5 [Physcomitrella patens]
MGSGILMLLLIAALLNQATPQPNVSFGDLYTPMSDSAHTRVLGGGSTVELLLDRASSGTCGSWGTYLFGTFSIGVRAVPGNSAGTVTAFYLQSSTASDIDQHDEIDFELLGRISPRDPYILQTNIYVNGTGRREQRMALWFDPSTDYHYFSLQWSRDLIVFYVDYVPIRVFRNNAALGVPYPDYNPMRAYASLWDGSIWATVDGNMRVHPVNWADAPFVASFADFDLHTACNATTTTQQAACERDGGGNRTKQSLDLNDISNLSNIHSRYIVYDYCSDTMRPDYPAIECANNRYD